MGCGVAHQRSYVTLLVSDIMWHALEFVLPLEDVVDED